MDFIVFYNKFRIKHLVQKWIVSQSISKKEAEIQPYSVNYSLTVIIFI